MGKSPYNCQKSGFHLKRRFAQRIPRKRWDLSKPNWTQFSKQLHNFRYQRVGVSIKYHQIMDLNAMFFFSDLVENVAICSQFLDFFHSLNRFADLKRMYLGRSNMASRENPREKTMAVQRLYSDRPPRLPGQVPTAKELPIVNFVVIIYWNCS